MKWNKILIFSTLGILLLSCGGSKKLIEANSALNTMMANKSFQIEVKTAQPQATQAMTQIANSGLIQPGNNVNRIDLNGSGYFIKVAGDSVSANLPFYGERRMGGGYNDNPGIKFDGLAEDFEVIKNEEKLNYILKFNISQKTETFNVTAHIANNASSLVTLWSTHRNQIRYTGDVKELE